MYGFKSICSYLNYSSITSWISPDELNNYFLIGFKWVTKLKPYYNYVVIEYRMSKDRYRRR